jgi:dihydrolipoamide dehydrogenase
MTDHQDTFDFVIIGAGAAGEAAVEFAREGGHSAAIIDRDLFGGSCAFWACMPSKSLLHAAAVHHAGGDFPWHKASDFRDWMISREGTDYPSDASHEQRYRDIGAEPIRGEARLDGPGPVRVALMAATSSSPSAPAHACPTSRASTRSRPGTTTKGLARATCHARC